MASSGEEQGIALGHRLRPYDSATSRCLAGIATNFRPLRFGGGVGAHDPRWIVTAACYPCAREDQRDDCDGYRWRWPVLMSRITAPPPRIALAKGDPVLDTRA